MIPRFHPDLCTDCGGCVGVCPVDAVELFHGQVDITEACPTGALTSDTWPGEPATAEGSP